MEKERTMKRSRFTERQIIAIQALADGMLGMQISIKKIAQLSRTGRLTP
jgi:hypothetical protein